MANPPNIFPWIDAWWRTGGGAKVVGKRVEFSSAGGTTAVSENRSHPIGDGKYSVVIRYRCTEDVEVSYQTTTFVNEGGTGGKADSPRRSVVLPASPAINTKVWNFTVSHPTHKSYRLILRLNKPIIIESVEVVPEIKDSHIRSFDTVATAGKPRTITLTAESQPGDVAILFVSSSWGHIAHRAPDGWNAQVASTIGNTGRSGYIATKVVVNPQDTVNVNPWGVGSEWEATARDQASLIVVKGEFTPQVIPWQDSIPESSGMYHTIVASAMHDVDITPDEFWDAPGSYQIVAGGHNSAASWSAQHIQRVDPGGSIDIHGAKVPVWAAVRIPTSQGYTIHVYHNNEEIPARSAVLPRGCQTVDELLSTKGFVVAHRGGSLDWGEMTRKGYTNSTWFNVDALEISCHRTRDGVWFGCHDSDLRRTNPTAPTTHIRDMDWAEVNKYFTSGGEKFLTLEEFLSVWGKTHVIFADPKGGAAMNAEFFKFFDPKNTVIKFSGDATWLADAARAAGFKTWGYAYQSHIGSGELARWAPHWDILGMEMTVAEDPFKQAKDIVGDKPLMAHIIPTKSWYDTMIARGAVGCMVSGVASVKERPVV